MTIPNIMKKFLVIAIEPNYMEKILEVVKKRQDRSLID